MTFKQTYLEHPNESGWFWFCDNQSITPIRVDFEKQVILEMVGTNKPLELSKLKGWWQKIILPGNNSVTLDNYYEQPNETS